MINGTKHSVSKGLCLINGTKHNIAKGLTLINGTKHPINFTEFHIPYTFETAEQLSNNSPYVYSWYDQSTSYQTSSKFDVDTSSGNKGGLYLLKYAEPMVRILADYNKLTLKGSTYLPDFLYDWKKITFNFLNRRTTGSTGASYKTGVKVS